MKSKMKRFVLPMLIGLLILSPKAKADEGMWLLPLLEKLNYQTMKDMGLKLSPDEIYNINKSSLKDAIVIFGGGCTGEIISDDGLLLTNHHCGYDRIQSHTTLENDILGKGFWAKTKKEELPNDGLEVTFLIRIEHVTEKVLEEVTSEMSEKERGEIIDKVSKELSDTATSGTHYTAEVRSFFDKNEYFLFVYETFKDVRLVGTPPESIGKFGHDTDNWVWPRHTGDFSLFRVYSAPDGKPAEYAEKNIPLKPKHHLPISLKGIEKGDFTMVLGYPGGTDRYITSWGVEELMEVTHPNRITIRGARQDVLSEDMKASKEVYNKYASKYARSSNYWKYSIGQSKGIKRLKVIERKREEEKAFANWIIEEEKEEYKDVLPTIEEYYKSRRSAYNNLLAMGETFRATEMIYLAGGLMKLAGSMSGSSDNNNDVEKVIEELKEEAGDFFKDYNRSTDKKVVAAMLETYAKLIPAERQPDFFQVIRTKYKGDYQKYTEYLFAKSIFDEKDTYLAFLDNPSLKTLKKDPAYKIFQSLMVKRGQEFQNYAKGKSDFEQARRLYTKGMLEMNPDRGYYPDANFTMRLTYGSVGDYYPADAVHYSHYTTLTGVIEKEGPVNGEFEVAPKLKELYKSKNYGPYAADGYMPVNFTTNNDITGGNSGSPVINGNGELIGLAFDGNWEAMSGDIVFEDELQKCINVDIRYVLFIIDKFAGATHLIEELTIVE